MRRDSAPRLDAVPNVTPMVDVMLVLLIILMVVTPALLSGVDAEPPVGENLQPRPEIETDHTLSIDVRGALYLDKTPMQGSALGAALRAMYPAERLDRVLYLRAHRELDYGRVNDALEIARANGVAVVGLVAERPRP